MLWLRGPRTTAYAIECCMCQHPIDISSADARKADVFLPVAGEVRAGRVAADEYIRRLQAEGIRFALDIAQTSATWKCAHCGEESALTFGECWKCGRIREAGAGVAPAAGEPRTPFLDKAMKDDGSGMYGGIQL